MSLRRARHVFATGLLALGAFAFSQQHADAAGNCSGQTMGNYFDGFAYNSSRQPATYFYGASAFIVVKRGVRCYNSPANTYNFIYTWTMIAADNVKANNPNNNGWAQVGPVYGYTSSSTPPQFQWLSQSYAQAGGGMLDNRISSFTIDDQIGTRHAFRAYLDRGICGCARMVIDSTIWAATSFDPMLLWGAPFSPQYLSEASFLPDDQPGSVNSHDSFSAMGVYDANGKNTLVPCVLTGANDNFAAWGLAARSCTAFDIWTK